MTRTASFALKETHRIAKLDNFCFVFKQSLGVLDSKETGSRGAQANPDTGFELERSKSLFSRLDVYWAIDRVTG